MHTSLEIACMSAVTMGLLALDGVATCPWVTDGEHIYGFGGEPAHGYNNSTENVLQIGAVQPVHTGAAS